MAHRMDYANLSLLSDCGQFVALAGGEFEIENFEVLLYPFRTLRGGRGLGSMFLLRNVDAMTEQDPVADTLDHFNLLFGDLYIENGEATE